MKQITVGLLGCGTVGSGTVKLIESNQSSLAHKIGATLKVKTILVRDLTRKRDLTTTARFTDRPEDILEDPEIDIIVELMGGVSPAKEYMLTALRNGKHVVTANKDVLALYGKELFEAADAKGRDFMFEASVGGGIPIIRPLKQCLAANHITEVMGIVNGTTNYMLTKMTQEGCDFAEVLKEAQEKGYAEADPTADVGGFDAARKIAILASIAFNARVSLDDVYVEGITNVSKDDIAYAKELGYVIKLVAIARDNECGINVRVHPTFLPASHPMASVNDVFNAIYVRGDAVGETMFYGRGAGAMPTASAVVADIIDISRNIQHNTTGRILCTCFETKSICPVECTESAYFIALLVEDKPGVLAAIAGTFGDNDVSLNSVIQKRKVDNRAELVLITYSTPDANLRKAISAIEAMPTVSKVRSVIRVESEAGA